jgi:hypothetical protein
MSESEWNVGVAKHNETHPGYSDFIAWLRGKCFPTQDAAQVVYESEKNPVIDFRNLLKKYMQHVVDQEGTAFLHREPFEENLFSTEELKVLQAIELENS